MFDDIKDAIINFITHRLFALTILFLILFSILIYRLFSLQIINGQDYLDNFTVMSEKTITSNGQRGNIYDVNGNLLAYNRLTYSLTFVYDPIVDTLAMQENKSSDEKINEIICSLVEILNRNNDKIIKSFEIKKNKKGEIVFSSKNENTILNFKRDVYCVNSVDDLTQEQRQATAQEVYDFLKGKKMFNVSDSYDEDTQLKIVAIRYMLFLNRFNQYVPVTVAMDLSDKSVAAIKEAANELPGSEIESDSVREYNYSPYFSQIIGYTGIISGEEKDTLNADLKDDSKYNGNEVIGKTGLEQEYESVLRGKNGKQTVLVDSVGQIMETKNDAVAATTGNDLYLTIDAELQKKCYTIMEKYLAGIILSHFENTHQKKTTSPINITTTEVYFALFKNNVLDLEHLSSKKASATEQSVYSAIQSAKKDKLKYIRTELTNTQTNQDKLSDENQEYMSYVYKVLYNNDIIKNSEIDSNDEMFQKWNNDKTSLGEFLEYAIQKTWIDTSKFQIDTKYLDSDELMDALVDYIQEQMQDDINFSKIVLHYLIDRDVVSGKDCCTILFDQGVLNKKSDEDYNSLMDGTMSAYDFMYRKIKQLTIKPSQLGLDPCSGSIVVTDVNTGKVKALVSYPSFDNNKLANNLDDDYYASLLADITSPFLNRCTQSSTAPGSTFKMISAAAGLTEGVITNTEKINCKGIYDTITPPPKCSVYPGKHGKLNAQEGIEHSCNVFFFEVGYRLGLKADNNYDEELGLKKLSKYASMFGLDRTSGIELDENDPQISTQDSVRSAIGQGKNLYTPAQLARYVTTIANNGTCFDLSILDKQTDSEGNTVKEYEEKIANDVKLSANVWKTIHSGMYDVVHGEDHGEIFESMYTDVAGKTGTAEEDAKRASHALFVSYAPYEKPEIAVTVVIPYGYSSANAMQVAKEVYKYYFSSYEKQAAAKEKANKKKKDRQDQQDEDPDDVDAQDGTDTPEDTEESETESEEQSEETTEESDEAYMPTHGNAVID